MKIPASFFKMKLLAIAQTGLLNSRMDIEKRREQWRQHHRLKIVTATPDELAAIRERTRLYDLEYRRKNKEKRAAYKADPERKARWNAINREKYRVLKSHPITPLTYEEKIERARRSSREYARKNRSKRLEYYQSNRQRLLVQKSEYGRANRAKIAARERAQKRHKRNTNPFYRAVLNCYGRVNAFLKGAKSAHTMELLGCNRDTLKAHLQSLFKAGMTWENYGRAGWHIDHKIPLASFSDMTDPAQQRKAFHYTNLQPLWAIENMSKGKKILDDLSSVSTDGVLG